MILTREYLNLLLGTKKKPVILVGLKTKGTLLFLIVLVLYSLLKIIHMNCLILF